METMHSVHQLKRPGVLIRALMWRLWLMGLVVVVAMILAIVSAGFSLLDDARRQLDRAGELAVETADDFLESIEAYIHATGDALGAIEDIEPLLHHALERQPDITAIYFLDEIGIVQLEVPREGDPQYLGIRHPRMRASLRYLPPETDYISTVDFESFGFPTVDMAVTVTSPDGESLGLLFVQVDLRGMIEQITQVRVGDQGYVYLVDQDGQILARPGGELGQTGGLLQDEIGYTPYQLAALDDVEVYPGLKGDLVVGAGTPTEITDEWFAIVEQPVIEPLRSAAVQIIILTIAFTLSSVVVASIIRFSRQQIEQPLRQLRQSAEVVSGGNLRYRAELAVDNEFGELAAAFNTMASDLEGLVLNLEDRVAERTDDLRMTAELGRLVTVQRDLDLLLPYAVDIIQRRTGFYHVQIFLIDEQGEYAHLRASTGDVGRRLIEAKHQLAVGSRSVIGQVTQTGQPVIALDTADAAVVHRPNPLLPNTRSEMALPLRGARGVIGAIDVQSLEPVAFTEGDIETFQVLADQLANAIESARRIRALEQRAREAESLNRVLVGQAYSELARQRRASTVGYTRTGGELAEDREWTPALSRVVLGGETVVEQTATGRHLALPIISRGTTVGAFEFEFDEDEWHEDAVELAQVLVDRVTVSLETARLFEESQRLVAREQTVNRFTTQLQGQNEVEELLSIAAQEIRSALNARRAAIRIGGRQET